ncbi:hypothetical protein SAMN04515695_0456 [Pseudovibrio sp. Tun.PSC04-5.I4]|nr:hypothetical protein SAMN04515695_0456 [Pseudovibrio sp. Tun.PSC04-5.I4]
MLLRFSALNAKQIINLFKFYRKAFMLILGSSEPKYNNRLFRMFFAAYAHHANADYYFEGGQMERKVIHDFEQLMTSEIRTFISCNSLNYCM